MFERQHWKNERSTVLFECVCCVEETPKAKLNNIIGRERLGRLECKLLDTETCDSGNEPMHTSSECDSSNFDINNPQQAVV